MHLHECESWTLFLVDCLSNIQAHIHIHKMYLLEMPYALWQFALGSPFTLTSLLSHTLLHTHVASLWWFSPFDAPPGNLTSCCFCFSKQTENLWAHLCCRLLLLMFVLFACALFSYSFAYNKIKDCVWDFVFADLKRKPSANKRSTALAMP